MFIDKKGRLSVIDKEYAPYHVIGFFDTETYIVLRLFYDPRQYK